MIVKCELWHYNPNHDALGRFATKMGAGIYYKKSTLTPGYRSYQRKLKTHIRDSGIKEGRSYDIIKSGTKLNRFSSAAVQRPGPKYYSVTPNDLHAYQNAANKGLLGFDKGKKFYQFVSTPRVDLKIAKGEDVTAYLIKKYGDKKAKDVYKFVKKHPTNVASASYFKEIADGLRKGNKRYASYIGVRNEAIKDYVKTILKDKTILKEVTEVYRKKGYDGIVDPEDWRMWSEYPIILLNK